ncbi:agmatine deiminase family protein [Pseudosulfitobacter koreensis]|uniref:Agmatine deiminase family protein n=1 Tax=Pseudosulfitobacter koreensis TaxID=2968472 RepID=A0ABT1YWA1_9RHOB|nr:agmatine deiminase family protein [Pseudosulfitobacter koreense]MCR8825174.1 agmatine deiminase family protein [Pseudosulfitobacter koreense]
MTWHMPAETAPQDRIWMAFPREGQTLGETSAERDAGYAAWAHVASTIAGFQPVSMIVDPTEMARAKRMLSSEITLHERTIDDFWMRDPGPTFVHGPDGALAAVDWVFNGWGGGDWTASGNDRDLARFIADLTGVPVVPSLLVNEGGGIHVDGEGTVLLTETVQLDPDRNPNLDRGRVAEEIARTLGATKAIWLPRGLERDYDTFGTRGHVDIVACMPSPGVILLHDQRDPSHPDHAVMQGIRAQLAAETDAKGRSFEIIDLPAPETLTDAHGPVDWSYVNHLVINDAVIACAFNEPRADTQAQEILAAAYPGRQVIGVDATELFARGGGVHCITQQQPKPRAS